MFLRNVVHPNMKKKLTWNMNLQMSIWPAPKRKKNKSMYILNLSLSIPFFISIKLHTYLVVYYFLRP